MSGLHKGTITIVNNITDLVDGEPNEKRIVIELAWEIRPFFSSHIY